MESPKPATGAVIRQQSELGARLPWDDTRDLDAVNRGFLGTLADPTIRDADGRVVWDPNRYEFLEGDAPDTVNPSL